MKKDIQELIQKMSESNDINEIEKIRSEIITKVKTLPNFRIVRDFLNWNRTVDSYAYGRQHGISFPYDDQDIFNLLDLIED